VLLPGSILLAASLLSFLVGTFERTEELVTVAGTDQYVLVVNREMNP